jgi:ribosomal protein S18 acetylase RimI-like enzyme
MRTLVASWAAFARGAPGAAVTRHPGVVTAVFPAGPERDVFNNALLDRDRPTRERRAATATMEAAYAGVGRFAAWVHESDEPLRADLAARGYRVAESTLAMGLPLAQLRRPRPPLVPAAPDWTEHLRILEVPPGLLAGADPAEFHLLTAGLEGAAVATAMAFDHDGDCGIYNVSTLPVARRRGLGTALTVAHLHDAAARGARTASLQSSPMAERVYAAAGFRGLGRILEYVNEERTTDKRVE